MFKVALRSLLSHKLRMFLTAFSIVMGVAFVSGTYIFTDSINGTFNTLFAGIYEGIDLTVRPIPSEFGNLDDEAGSFDSSVLTTIQETEGVRLVDAELNGSAQYISAEGDPIGGNGPPTIGSSWNKHEELNILNFKAGNGRAPEGPGEVVIDANTAEVHNFSLGDEVTIQTTGPAEQFTIVGIASFGQEDSLAGATLAIFEYSEAERLFGLEGQISTVSIKVEAGHTKEEVAARLNAALSSDIEVVTGEQQTQEFQNDVGEALGFINTALLAFAGIAIFVSTFIIQNTFRIIISQRSKELALLRAVGATRKQVISLVMYEAFIVGLLASVIGLYSGSFLAEGIRAAGNAAGLGLPDGDLVLLTRTIVVGMSTGVLVTLFSAAMPAIRASKVSPVEALSDNEGNQARRSLKKRGIVNLAITLVGAAALLFGLFGSIASPLIYVGLGVTVMFLGVAGLAPLLSGPLSNIIGAPFTKLRGMPGKLAKENTKRTPRRTASTASALMIGVALVTLVSVFASSVNATVETIVAESFPADVIALSSNAQSLAGVPAQFGQDLGKLEELDSVSRVRYDEALIDGHVELVALVNPETFGDTIKIEPSEGAYENLDSSSVVVEEKHLEAIGMSVGDEVTVDLGDSTERTLTVVGTFSDNYDASYLINRELHITAMGETADTFVAANYASGIDSIEARAAVDKVADDYPTVNVQDQSEIVEQSKAQINGLLGMFWALLGFAILIAVLGITNTLALSIAERKRELGLLRAVGMTKRQVRTMVRVESIIISLFGATMGIFMGTFFAWAILKALESEGLTSFVIPVNQIIAYYILAAIAGVIASIWPAFSAARVNVLDAINFE